jgi:hypothetical protein
LTRAARARAQSRARRAAITVASSLIVSLPSPARAADDGAFGRLDGDLELDIGAGPAFASGGPALGVDLAAIYLSAAGIYGYYTDALGSKGADVVRSIAAGAELRPLFLGRYAKNLEEGPPRLDLFIDSIALGVGAFWHVARGEAIVSDPGLELALSIDFPFFADATGPFLGVRGALRWRASDFAGRGEGGVLDRGALLSVTLAWHHVLGVHLVDAQDRRPE